MEALRGAHFKGSITMIGNEGYLPIDRTKLSKALISDPAKIAWRDEEWFKSASIDQVHDTVTGVDFSKKVVSTKSGSSYVHLFTFCTIMKPYGSLSLSETSEISAS